MIDTDDTAHMTAQDERTAGQRLPRRSLVDAEWLSAIGATPAAEPARTAGAARRGRSPRAGRCPEDIVVVRGLEVGLEFSGLGGKTEDRWDAERSAVEVTFALGRSADRAGSHGALAYTTNLDDVRVQTAGFEVRVTSPIPLVFGEVDGWSVTEVAAGGAPATGGAPGGAPAPARSTYLLTADAAAIPEVTASTPIGVVPAALSERNAIPWTEFAVQAAPGAFADGQRVLGVKHRFEATVTAQLDIAWVREDCYPGVQQHEDSFLLLVEPRVRQA